MDRHIIVIALRLGDNPPGVFRFFSFRQYEHVQITDMEDSTAIGVTIPISSQPDMNAFIYRGGATRPNTTLSEILPSARTYVEQCIRRNYAGRVGDILDFRFVFIVPARYSTLNREQLDRTLEEQDLAADQVIMTL
jgi:hypothetical protein